MPRSEGENLRSDCGIGWLTAGRSGLWEFNCCMTRSTISSSCERSSSRIELWLIDRLVDDEEGDLESSSLGWAGVLGPGPIA